VFDDVTETQVQVLAVVTKADAQAWLNEQGTNPDKRSRPTRCALCGSSLTRLMETGTTRSSHARQANGPLRVLPGTHTGGLLTHDEIQRLAAVVTPVACMASAGGVVAMRPLVVHASSKASDNQPRRVLHIEYATSVHLGAGLELAVG